MAEKRHEQSGFKVTDRRLFTAEGELRGDAPEEAEVPKAATTTATATAPTATVPTTTAPTTTAPTTSAPQAVPPAEQTAAPVPETMTDAAPEREMPPPPTNAEQEAQAAAYRQSAQDLDSQVELSGHSAKEFEMTFERFLASLYMTAMMQLGLMRQQGEQPRVDIIGARQTIDTLSLIGEKTKGNLTPVEGNFLMNSLYELRMAYVEVTNALARPPQPGPATGNSGGIRGR
jgi:hypothetical protein